MIHIHGCLKSIPLPAAHLYITLSWKLTPPRGFVGEKAVLREQKAVCWKHFHEFETSFWRAKRQYLTQQVDFFTGSLSMKSEPPTLPSTTRNESV